MESINLTLVVGLAVDYAVHLADGYVQANHYSRKERVRYMLGHVGISVIAGASTTLGASAFMLGSNLLFFLQFGIFMFCTIGFSIVYALVLFTILVGIIGPEGNSGNLRQLFPCTRKCDPIETDKSNLAYNDEERSQLNSNAPTDQINSSADSSDTTKMLNENKC